MCDAHVHRHVQTCMYRHVHYVYCTCNVYTVQVHVGIWMATHQIFSVDLDNLYVGNNSNDKRTTIYQYAGPVSRNPHTPVSLTS